jgi:hypothetical protein
MNQNSIQYRNNYHMDSAQLYSSQLSSTQLKPLYMITMTFDNPVNEIFILYLG